MGILGLVVLFSLIIGSLVWGIGFFISSKMDVDKESGAAYECGFESSFMARVPFSLQFFLVGVIFLVFDVEIVLMLPVLFMLDWGLLVLFLFLSFVLVLLSGLYFEWSEGSLEWVK